MLRKMIMKKIFVLFPLIVFLSACTGVGPLSTAQDLEVTITGTDAAHCILSTRDNRYSLLAPGVAYIERDSKDLKVDCKDNLSPRRRVVTVEPFFKLGYWEYPEKVDVNFATMDSGNLMTGFRTPDGVLTEKSFSRTPVDRDVYIQTRSSLDDRDMTPLPSPLAPLPKEGERGNLEVNDFEMMLDQKLTVESPRSQFNSTQDIYDSYQGRRSFPVEP
jgi:hypothetical protein